MIPEFTAPDDWTPEQVAEFEAEWERLTSDPEFGHKAGLEYPFDVGHAINKAAGGVSVKLTPPFRAESDEALAQFQADFDAYCEAAWVLACLSPTEISLPVADAAWPRGQVHGPMLAR